MSDGCGSGWCLGLALAWGRVESAQPAKAAQGDTARAAGAASTAGAASNAKAEFEVASIKPSDPNVRILFMGSRSTPDGLEGTNMTVAMLVRAAYGGYQALPSDDYVTGLPEWAKTERFDLKAKMSDADAEAMKTLSEEERQQRT